jgi:hypothetical protein
MFCCICQDITTSKYNSFGGLSGKASLSTMMDVVDLKDPI